ncbi:WD40 repeat-like protein [Schizopora paradoxa]|uniref:WD40 repeat-like protein n=1 Tax=Schizopora paradoxa TaxID=27342 RepID=A0A0H2SRK6_9AGAM|nr:WD40 repeat-like protein [Schizopora paradoxa]
MESAFADLEWESKRVNESGEKLVAAIGESARSIMGCSSSPGGLQAAQISLESSYHRRELGYCSLAFREAVVIEKLIDRGAIEDKSDAVDAVVKSFLRDKLDPPEQPPVDGGCLDGTRKTILRNVDKWLESDDAPNVFWISGAPGAGKTALASTIVQTISRTNPDNCETYHHVSFFIKRRDANLRDPRSIWRSIAFELTEIYRGVKVDILEVLSETNNCADPKMLSIEDQFRDLILKPLKSKFLQDPHKLVVVIDALDECVMEDQDHQCAFLDTIEEWCIVLPPECKLVVSSRNETKIVAKLKNISLRLPIDTGDIVSRESNDDIRHFLKTKFQEMDVDAVNWPEPDSVAKLTDYATGIFVWAATVIEVIREDPIARLKEVLDNIAAVSISVTDKDKVGKLYGQVLLKAVSRLRHPQEFDSLSLVLASVTSLRKNLPLEALEELLNFERSSELLDLPPIISQLKPVVVIEGDKNIIRVRHRSFSDFLLDETRLQDSISNILMTYTLDRKPNTAAFSLARRSALFAERCLRSMNCGLKSYQTVVSEPLEYACHHWADHLTDMVQCDPKSVSFSTGDIHLASLVKTFLKEHTLHWMEVLSRMVTQKPSAKSVEKSSLMFVADYMENFDANISGQLRSASTFMGILKEATSISRPLLYVQMSKQSFESNDNPSSMIFGSESKCALTVVPLNAFGRQIHRNPLVYAERIHTSKITIIYPAHPLEASQHWQSMEDIPFFILCGRFGVVSPLLHVGGKEGVLPVSNRRKYTAHQDDPVVQLLANINDGPGGSKLACRFESGKLGIWDIGGGSGGRLYEPIFPQEISAATFTASQTLIIGSFDGSITVFDLATQDDDETFRFIPRAPLQEHFGAIQTLASSPNGARFVSGSSDRSLIIWDTNEGKALHWLYGHYGSVCSVAWSIDERFIVSGSDDSTVRVWSSKGESLGVIDAHSDVVSSVLFYGDSDIVSSSCDGSIQFWDRVSGYPIGEKIIRNAAVYSIAFSADNNTLAAVYDDSCICLWDVRTWLGKRKRDIPASDDHSY